MKPNNVNNSNNITNDNSNTLKNGKKIFAPNIPSSKLKKNSNGSGSGSGSNIITTEMILNPTKSELKSREPIVPKLHELSTSPPQYNSINNSKIISPTNTSTTSAKPVILKIKRKIDDDALPSILIERPKKKAFLDSFKDFGIDDSNDKDEHKLSTNSPLELIAAAAGAPTTSTSISTSISTTAISTTLENETIKTPTKKQPEKDKKLFTLITTLEDPTVNSNKLLSKFQQRLEEFNNKGLISSPKQLESKKERTNKKRKESRYKQININRSLLSKEERELFENHDIIELERTTIDHDNLLGSALSKEEEALISNYRSMLEDHFNSASIAPSSSSSPLNQDKYVYDYYYFDPTIDQHTQLARLNQGDPDSIETVELPPEDDFYDILDGGDSDESSVDSENWYREYPSSEDDEDDGYDDFDNYHRSNRIVNSDEDDYEYDEYAGDYYNEDDYDDSI